MKDYGICECGGKLTPQFYKEHNVKKHKDDIWLSHLTCELCLRNYIVCQACQSSTL